MTPKQLYELARRGNKLTHEQELVIATDSILSYQYALVVLKGRFELGEIAISKSVEYSYYYSIAVLHARFELGEAAIVTNNLYRLWYVTEVSDIPFVLIRDVLASVYKDEYINWYFRRQ